MKNQKWKLLWPVLACVYCVVIVGFIVHSSGIARSSSSESIEIKNSGSTTDKTKKSVLPLDVKKGIQTWWSDVPDGLRKMALETGGVSNIGMKDYVGPDSCKECHAQKHAAWSKHSHRFMNALATPETLKMQFDGRSARIMGGDVRVFTENGGYKMEMVKGATKRRYSVVQTIGSRFFQYYIGRLEEGMPEDEEKYYTTNQLLPVGYWINPDQLVPVVHVDRQDLDGDRWDPHQPSFASYAKGCTGCHTTPTIGDWLIRYKNAARNTSAFDDKMATTYSPWRISFDAGGYLQEYHQFKGPIAGDKPWKHSTEVEQWLDAFSHKEATETAVTLGISCEACHLGCKEHVESPKVFPRFFPSSKHLLIYEKQDSVFLRTSENVNWVCARCHSGNRPLYAGGMSTWNSVEYSDAVRGACYSELTCVHCHDPHEATGQKWPLTPQEDDAKCLACHSRFKDSTLVQAHTHHTVGSEGSRCMNCHMPRINEGLEHVVRTHTIFSPTLPSMLTSNQPNACNICHLDKSINWTTKYLDEWYGKKFSGKYLSENYKDRNAPVGIEWLNSESRFIRLMASWSLIHSGADWAREEVFAMLDDPYLLGRQFTQKGIQDVWGVNLRKLGYEFHMLPEERKIILDRIRDEVLGSVLRKVSDPR